MRLTSQRIYQNLNETIQRNEQSADFRYTSLKKQLESVQERVSDNANALSRILQNRCYPKMSTPSTVGSDNTDVKRRSQSSRSVATTTTFSNRLCVRLWVLLNLIIKILHIYRLLRQFVIHIRMLQI